MAKRSRATFIDVEIGLRLRRIRLDCGLTQDELGERLGVTYQQVQKYESGHNRVSAGRLWYIARILGCAVGDFLPDASFDEGAAASLAGGRGARHAAREPRV